MPRCYTRKQLAVAFLAGAHRRTGSKSALAAGNAFVLQRIFEMAVPAVDVSADTARADVASATEARAITARCAHFSPKSFDELCELHGFTDLAMGGRCCNTVMHSAVYGKNVDLIDHLCRRNSSLLRMRRNGGMEPIHVAASLGVTTVIDALVRNGANVNAYAFDMDLDDAIGIDAGTPLAIAVACKNVAAVRCLLGHGACIVDDEDAKRLESTNEEKRKRHRKSY